VGKRWLVGGIVALGVAVVGSAMAWRAYSASAAEARKKAADAVVALEFMPAEVVRPLLAAMPERIEFSGPLIAPRTAVVRAKAPGTLLALSVVEGSRVKAGQPLGAIDLADLQSRVEERSANVEALQARVVEAERAHAANEGLARQHFISATALETSRATLEAARAQLKSGQAQLATSRLGVREAALAAPIAGVVGKRSVLPGEKVSAEQELLTVVDLRQLELAGVVGTHQISLLRTGMPVSVRVEGQREAVAGRIDRIAPAAEPGTRGIRVVVLLDNPRETFRAGQYATASVVLDDAIQRLTLPAGAVGQASGQDFVWTLENDALVRRIVITGRRDAVAGRVEVNQGIGPQAEVIAARFGGLKEGAPARVVAQRAPLRTAPTASAVASQPRT
jgi:RND family efflux transporter MFP subunit